jgi:hypothetical protein
MVRVKSYKEEPWRRILEANFSVETFWTSVR